MRIARKDSCRGTHTRQPGHHESSRKHTAPSRDNRPFFTAVRTGPRPRPLFSFHCFLIALYCRFTGITTYRKSGPTLITPGLFGALSSRMTSGSDTTFSTSMMNAGLNPISMSSPS